MSDPEYRHVLVVDDSPGILALKHEILELERLRVSTMLRRDTGLPEIVAAEPDLLVMELLPLNESSLMADLANDPRTKQIPILLCTGAIQGVDPDTLQMDRKGVKVIVKPFDIDEFVAAVFELIGPSAESDKN